MASLPEPGQDSILEDWLKYIQSLHNRTMDLTLDRAAKVIHRICPGKVPFRVVSVAGTNGKGSVATMLESIFRHSGYLTGLYTSPHLVKFNERFVVGGVEISDEELLQEFRTVEEKRGTVPLTFFEFGTAIAIDYFMRKNVDVAILEVGLGGRKDAVNVLDADLACITAVGTDHKKWLGATRELIGYEKAGILRKSQFAVCTDTSPPESVRKVVDELDVKLYLGGQDFEYKLGGSGWQWTANLGNQQLQIDALPPPPIPGKCQIDNTAGAVTIAVLARKYFDIPCQAIREGVRSASIKGRLQLVQLENHPQVVLDVAHNAEAVRILGNYLTENPVPGKNIAVMSVLSEKPIEEIVHCVEGQFDIWHLCEIADGSRGVSIGELYGRVSSVLGCHENIEQYSDVQAAFESAIAKSSLQDRIVVFGSFLTVGGIIQFYQ